VTSGLPFYDTRMASHRGCANSEQQCGPMAIHLMDFRCVAGRSGYAGFAIGRRIAGDNGDEGENSRALCSLFAPESESCDVLIIEFP
jgi:hypothetical protein